MVSFDRCAGSGLLMSRRPTACAVGYSFPPPTADRGYNAQPRLRAMSKFSASTSRRRRVVAIFAALALLVCIWIGAVAVMAWIRAPKLVTGLDQAGALPLLPTQLSRWQTCALLSVQDPEFYGHRGVGLFKGPLGHTTITQAIAKGLFFERFTPGVFRQQKVKLMVMAWALDWRVPKETQLRVFLNRAYFGTVDGREVRGFQNAAATFFGKELSTLSEQQYLALVAMLVAPNAYDPRRHPEASAERVATLRSLVQQSCPMPSK